jgi:peptidoglycan/xylan/chitin deacetylase (PgdA/CDA1 family)
MTTTHKGTAVLILAVLIGIAFIPAAPAFAESAVSVLCYHSFHDRKKMDPFCFTLEELNSHIMQLKKEGFRFVSVYDIINGRITGTKNVLITVDDGNKSVYEAYQKVFRPNGIRPLLAIYPNIIINKKKYALTWEQLTELANTGCDIAAHGYFHLRINKKLHDKNPAYFQKEIFLSKKVLEEKLNRKISIFVYPFGLRDDMTIKALKEAGYRYAFTIDNGKINVPVEGGGDKLYELPRYMVTRTSWKYCFNWVMKNARPKVAYKVAATRDVNPEKAGLIETKKREKIKDMVSNTNLMAGHDSKPVVKDNTYPTGKREMFDIFGQNDGAAMIAPIQRVLSNVRRDVLSLDSSAAITGPDDRNTVDSTSASLLTQNRGTDESTETDGGRFIMKGKVEHGGSGNYLKIKNRYHKMNLHSYGTYHDFLGLVKEKVDRIKHTIKKYVVGNF